MNEPDPRWLDAQYNNRARVADHARFLERWASSSARARAALPCRLDLRYGDQPGETLDVFEPAAPDAPVLVFIHGGYWRALDKSDASFVAPPFVEAGAMVVVPNYDLCPSVGMETIALQLAHALAWTHRHAREHGGDPSRLVVCGHSAGGHVVAMMLCCDGTALGSDLPPRLATRGVAVSGLFDLEAVRRTPFLQDLALTPESVARLSPARFPPPAGATLHAVVGGAESEEFLRQNALIRESWGPQCVPVCEAVPRRNHFDILDELVDPASPVHEGALGLLGLRPA